MIALIRHSERLDRTDRKKWERSKRFKENENDTPITKKGKKLVINATKKLFKNNFDEVDVLYSSPLTRCVQTCLIIKNEIKKKFGKNLKIKIDYGLVEVETVPLKVKNNKFIENLKKPYVDSELYLENLIKKYGDHFDKSYKSSIKENNVKFDKTLASAYNKRLKVYKKIEKENKNINKYKALLKIYDQVDIINDII